MNEITIGMAVLDFIPVVLFLFSCLILKEDLKTKMTKNFNLMFIAGFSLISLGGLLKCIWKFLYALNIGDFTVLSEIMFPLHGIGFMSIFISLLLMLRSPELPETIEDEEKVTERSSLPAISLASVKLPFLTLMIIGTLGFVVCLIRICLKMDKKEFIRHFITYYICMLGMSVLGAKFDNNSLMHWYAQLINIAGQVALFVGIYQLHGAGLARRKKL